jgi:hypothetical protein
MDQKIHCYSYYLKLNKKNKKSAIQKGVLNYPNVSAHKIALETPNFLIQNVVYR